ncbi:MAG: CHAD domain-containing protein [Acidobacteriia bacterium]|nr:CHAD domain-containing protein [Terriglobia bacterium]
MPIDRQRNQMLCRRLSRLLNQVADKPQPDTVHQFRTTARRIEALLEALSPDPDKNQRRLTKRVVKLRRRAGRVRDIDVQMAALRSLKIGRDAQRKDRLMQALAELRSKREKRLVSVLDKETIREVRKRLRKAAKGLSLFAEPAAMDGALDAAAPFDPIATSLRMFVRVARAQGAPLREDNLHAYRLETKHVRYVAEMAGEDQTAQKIVAELKRMQDTIGEWHDWLVLTQRAQEMLAPAPESPLIAALQNVTRAKFREAISVCTDARKNLLEVARTVLPPRKSAAGVHEPAVAASA